MSWFRYKIVKIWGFLLLFGMVMIKINFDLYDVLMYVIFWIKIRLYRVNILKYMKFNN